MFVDKKKVLLYGVMDLRGSLLQMVSTINIVHNIDLNKAFTCVIQPTLHKTDNVCILQCIVDLLDLMQVLVNDMCKKHEAWK